MKNQNKNRAAKKDNFKSFQDFELSKTQTKSLKGGDIGSQDGLDG